MSKNIAKPKGEKGDGNNAEFTTYDHGLTVGLTRGNKSWTIPAVEFDAQWEIVSTEPAATKGT